MGKKVLFFNSVLKLHPSSSATYTPRFYCEFSHMQLLVAFPTFIEDLLVLLRLLLWSKHEKVPVHFFFKTAASQWKLLLSLQTRCLYKHGLLNTEYVRSGAGAGRAGRAVCTHRRSAIVLQLFEGCRWTKERGSSRTGSQPKYDDGLRGKAPSSSPVGLKLKAGQNTVTLGACPLTKTFSNMWQSHVSPYSWAHLLFPFTSFPLASLFAWSRNGCWLPVRIMGRKRCEPSKAVIGHQVLVKVSRYSHLF